MLILGREKNQRVMIGEDIVVTVVDILDGRVRLGFEAPENVIVDREEIHEARKASKRNSDER